MSKKKVTDPEGSMEELIARAVEVAQVPFTPSRKSELPSLRSIAEQLGTTVIRTRKLLITAGYFTSPTASTVQRLKAEGQSIEEIGAALRLKPAAVYGYLPYENLAYNLPQTTSNADRHKRYRATKKLKAAVDTGSKPSVPRTTSTISTGVAKRGLQSLISGEPVPCTLSTKSTTNSL